MSYMDRAFHFFLVLPLTALYLHLNACLFARSTGTFPTASVCWTHVEIYVHFLCHARPGPCVADSAVVPLNQPRAAWSNRSDNESRGRIFQDRISARGAAFATSYFFPEGTEGESVGNRNSAKQNIFFRGFVLKAR